LCHLLAFYFELIVFECDNLHLLQSIPAPSLGIVVILLAVCPVTPITTGSFSMRMQQSLFKCKSKFTPSRTTLAINFSAVRSTTSVYTPSMGCALPILSEPHMKVDHSIGGILGFASDFLFFDPNQR
jgi:hypothetical protein